MNESQTTLTKNKSIESIGRNTTAQLMKPTKTTEEFSQDMFGKIRPRSGFKGQKSMAPVLDASDLKYLNNALL